MPVIVDTPQHIVVSSTNPYQVNVIDHSNHVEVTAITLGETVSPIETVVDIDGAAPTLVVHGVGIQGPKGDPGVGGAGAVSYSVTAVSSWTQAHDFPYFPEVHLVDSLGEGVEIGVEYPDASHVFIEFPQPFTGKVILS